MGTVYTECVSTVPLSREASYFLSFPRNLTSTVMETVYTECVSTVPLMSKANYFLSFSRNLTSNSNGNGVYRMCINRSS